MHSEKGNADNKSLYATAATLRRLGVESLTTLENIPTQVLVLRDFG